MPIGSQQQPPLRALPALLIAASFASGIGAAMLFADTDITLGVAAVTAIIGIALAISQKIRKYGLLIIVAATGMADYAFSTEAVSIPAGNHLYSGVVELNSPTTSRQAAVVIIDSIDHRPTRQFRVRLTVEQGNENVEEGFRLTFQAELHRNNTTEDYPLPDVASNSEIMERSGIAATAFLVKERVVSIEEAKTFMASIRRLRNDATEIIYRSSLNANSKLFLSTALLGRQNSMSPDLREDFAKAGLSHILALSGLHLAIIAALLYWLLAPLLIFFSRHIRSISILVIIWGYAFLTGLGAPVVRAAVMTSLVLRADLLQRRTFALNSLMFAALIILVFSPTQLREAGFQLSFLAVASIISFADYFNPASSSRNIILRGIGGAIGMSVAAMLSTGLISALWFHSVPVLFLVANIIVGPLIVPLILGGGIAIIVASLTHLPYGPVAKVVDWCVFALEWVASRIASIPWASLEIWTLSAVTVMLVLATLAVIAARLRRPESSQRLSGVALMLGVCTLISAFTTGKTASRDAIGTWHYLPSSDYCDIIFPIRDTIYLYSDAPLSTIDYRVESISRRLKEYMGRRNISAVIPIGNRIYIDGLMRNNSRLRTDSCHIVIAGHGFVPGDTVGDVDLLVLARGYNGNLKSLCETLRPERVCLSPALNPKLRKRYEAELGAIRPRSPIFVNAEAVKRRADVFAQ